MPGCSKCCVTVSCFCYHRTRLCVQGWGRMKVQREEEEGPFPAETQRGDLHKHHQEEQTGIVIEGHLPVEGLGEGQRTLTRRS